MPYQVANFGYSDVSGSKEWIGNHEQSVHETLDGARVQMFINMSKLEEDGYKLLEKYEGDAVEEGYTMQRNRTFINAGYWEVW